MNFYYKKKLCIREHSREVLCWIKFRPKPNQNITSMSAQVTINVM